MSSNIAPQSPSRNLSLQAESTLFLKEHMALGEIMKVTRARFAEIDELLLQEKINKHDQGHQLRTAINTVAAMRQMGFKHREILQAATGALIHDIGYNKQDEPEINEADEYNSGKKAQFKKHALYGANETKEILLALIEEARNTENEDLKRSLTFKSKSGHSVLMDEEDVYRITEAILNHNDYGKDDESYDPRGIGGGALMVQLFDKLDICRQRVYKEHMEPNVFIPENEHFDPKYYHRVAPYCITGYDFSIDQQEGEMEMRYQVDLNDFRELMKKDHPEFEYGEDDFIRDFKLAYEKNCRIAAEAVGTAMERITPEDTLKVQLCFPNGRTETLSFARPDREVYKERGNSMRVSIGEILNSRSQAPLESMLAEAS